MQHPRNLAEWQKAVERQLRANKSGVQIAITHGTDEAQVVRDEVDGFKNLQPTAPVELNVQTSTYIDAGGHRRGRVIIGFPPVTLSTTAEPLTVAQYELSAQLQESLAYVDGKAETLVDSFTSLDASKWTAGAGITFSGGAVNIPASAAYPALRSVDLWDVSNSSVSAKVSAVPNVDAAQHSTAGGLQLWVDSNNVLEISAAADTITFVERVAGVVDSSSLAYNATAMRYWRIRAAGTTILWETSPDNVAWTTRKTKTTTLTLTSMGVSLFAGNWGSVATPGSFSVDELNPPGSTVALEAWHTVATASEPSLMAMDFNPNSLWKFRTRALAGNFTLPGQWSEEVTVTMVSDSTPPPQPSTPVGSVVLATMKVAWDGKAAGGGAMPADLERVELAFGLTSSPTTIIDTYYSADPTFTMVPKSAYNVPHYFRLRAVDTSGNIGPWSPQITLIPTPLVDVDVIQSQLDGAKLIIDSVASAALKDQAITTAKLAGNAVDQTKLANQAVSLAKLATDASDKIQKGIDDAFTADSKAYNAQLAADKAKLIADAAVAQAQNTVPDSVFGLGSERWDWQTFPASTTFPAVSDAHRGANVLQMTATGSLVQVASDYKQPVSQGQIWEISGWVRVSGTLPTAGDVRLACIVNDTSGASTFPAQVTLQATALTTTWQRMVGYYTVPAGIASLQFRMRLDALTTSGTLVQWSDVAMRDVTTAKSALDAAQQAQTDATTAITNASTALTSASGKNTITNSIVDANISIPGVTTGDRWQKWTTLAIGGKMLATWRWNGSAWIAEAMDATYLPLIDIGAGTFGTLKGNQFASNTISVKNLLVGSFDNVIPDPYFTNANLEWGAPAGTVSFPATEGYGGLSAFKQTPNASQTGRYSQRIPVEGGSSYRVQVWVKSDVAIPAAALGMYHNYAVAGSSTGLSPVNFLKQTTGAAGNDAIPANTWTLLTGVAKMNALADTAAFGFFKQTTFTTGTVWFSQASAVRMGDGNLLVDGSVTALAMAANSVSAKNIIVGDFQNFALGSDFEDATAVPWTLNTLHTLSTTQKKFGTTSLRLGPNAAAQSSRLVADLKVKEGEEYNFKFHAYIDASFNGTATNSKLRIGNQANTFLADIPFSGITRSAWTTAPLELAYTVPAGVTALTIELWSNHTAGFAYIDDIQIRRMAEASLIQNLGVEQLVAGAANIDSGVITKLWTDVVQSQKITTDMLVVTAGTNMVPDPTFTAPESRALKTANNATGWDTYVSASGIQALRYGNATPSWPSVGYLNLFDFDSTPGVADKTNWIPVLAGEVYEFAGRFFASDPGITTKMYVSYLKDDGTTTGYSSPTITPATAPDGGPNRSPVWEFTIPANVIKMGARIEHRGTTGWVSIYGDSTYLHKKVDANLVVDGAIVAKHLTVTDEMWTKILHFKLIGGDEIDANNIIADTAKIGVLRGGILINDAVDTGQLKATAITSKHTITGAKFQTVTTANRGLKFDSTGLKMWDPLGVQTLNADAATGYLTVTGRIRSAPDGQPGVLLIPSSESDDGKTMAAWFLPDTALVPGQVSAGIWMSNPGTIASGAVGKLNMRGQNYGGIVAWDGIDIQQGATGGLDFISGHSGAGLQITGYGGNLYLTSGAAETRIKSVFNTSINVGTGKTLNLQVNSSPYSATNGASANLLVFTDGNVFKSTSASKFKILPNVMALDDRLLTDVRVKDWIDKGMAERYAASFDHVGPYTEQEQREFDALSLERIPGAIAEDVQVAGGEKFITRDLEGEIEGLMYDRFALARTELLYEKYLALVERVAALEAGRTAAPRR